MLAHAVKRAAPYRFRLIFDMFSVGAVNCEIRRIIKRYLGLLMIMRVVIEGLEWIEAPNFILQDFVDCIRCERKNLRHKQEQ